VFHKLQRVGIILVISGLFFAGCQQSPEEVKARAFQFYDLQQYKEAHPLLEKAFASGLDDPEMIVRLAYCRAVLAKDVNGAIDILRDSALKYPRYARTYFELGFIAYNFGPNEGKENIKQALGFARMAVKCDSTDWRSMDNLGMYLVMLDSLDEAQAIFLEAQKLKADFPELNTRIKQVADLIAQRDSLRSAADSVKAEPIN